MSAADLTGEDWARYVRSAAPEAIAGELSSLRGAARRANDRVSKLEVLLARRCREVADGTWPHPPTAKQLAARGLTEQEGGPPNERITEATHAG